jgi:hypothetical protein
LADEENEMNNKVVARYKDGRMIKGATIDFSPGRDVFHVIDSTAPNTMPVMVQTRQLKALFFVKDLIGDPEYGSDGSAPNIRPALGRKVRVVFNDGEVMVGRSATQPATSGIFVEPEDPSRNEQRAFVLFDATQDVQFF